MRRLPCVRAANVQPVPAARRRDDSRPETGARSSLFAPGQNLAAPRRPSHGRSQRCATFANMGNRVRHKSAKHRRVKVDPMNRLFRPACTQCDAPVDWLTDAEVTARGIDLAQSMDLFEITAIPNRDVWVCTPRQRRRGRPLRRSGCPCRSRSRSSSLALPAQIRFPEAVAANRLIAIVIT